MNCRYVQSRLSAYIDSELTGFQQQAIRHHLQRCPDCTQEYEQIKQTKRLVNYLRPAPPIKGAEDRLMIVLWQQQQTGFASSRKRSFFDFFWVRFSWAAAAAVMLLWLAPRDNTQQTMTNTSPLPPSLQSLTQNPPLIRSTKINNPASFDFPEYSRPLGVYNSQGPASSWENQELLQPTTVPIIFTSGWR
jgi:hypothetical protein